MHWGGSVAFAEDKTSTIDFENQSTTYSDWIFTNMTSMQSGSITAHGGTYYGTTGGKATASITTKEKIASPKTITFYVSKQSNNTTSSSWKLQTSSDNSTWTDVKTQSATSMSKGTWVVVTQDLSSYSDVYIRIYYTGSTAVRNIDDVELTFSTGSTETKTVKSLSIEGTPADLWKGDEFTHEGITVTATYDDLSTKDVTNSCEYSGYDMSTAGEQTVTVTYGGQTTTYDVTVKTIGNTQETAYTATEAIALIDAGKGLKTPVYVKGKVSRIVTPFSSDYGNITFDVSADGTTEGDQFQFFRNVKGADNEKYTSEDECPKVGDEVIGYGTLTKYNTTYEFDAGNYLVEKIVSTDPSSELTLSQTTGEVNVDKTLDIHGFVSTATGYTGTVAYAVTSGSEYASVNEEGVITGLAVGTATIKVTAPAVVGSFTESSAEFTVTVVENRTATTVTFGAEVDDQTFNVNLGETFEGKTATVSPAEAGNVTYASDKPEVASVDENTGAITIGSKEGTATITASFAATDTHQASSAKYYITVTDPNIPVYKKVTSNEDIVDGEQYLIICEDNNKAMSSYNNKYYNVVDVTVTDNTYEGKVNADGLPYTVTVHKSATDGYYTLETAEGYVKSTTGDNTSIYNSEMTSEEDVFLWKIDVTNSYSPIYSKYVPARFIAYNSDQPRIALYKSTSNASQRVLVSLYKKIGSIPAEPAYGELTFKAQDSDEMYYATFSSDKDVVFTKDVVVSAVAVSDNKLSITDLSSDYYEVTDATVGEGTGIVEDGYYVPANNGVLVSCTDAAAKYYFPKTEDETVTITNNQLKAAPAGGDITPVAGHVYYKLAYNNFNTKTGLGFYWGAEDGGAFKVKKGLAYLDVTSTGETSAKGFSFDGTTTDISSVATEGKAKEIFNIAGQKVNAMTKAGLYIVNGKKMVIKK